MKRYLLLSLLLMGLTFLGISTAEAMEGDDLVESMRQLSVSGTHSQALRFTQAKAPEIRIDSDGWISVEGHYAFQKGEEPTIKMRLRNPVDADFYVDDLSSEPYVSENYGPITKQRADAVVMRHYESGAKAPDSTIGNWRNMWKPRLNSHNAAFLSTVFTLEEMGEGDVGRFVGHIGIGNQAPTQWVYFCVLDSSSQQKGIGESTFRYVLGTLIPSIFSHPELGVRVPKTSLLIKADHESPLAPIIGPKVAQLRAEGYHVDHNKNADRPGGRKGHEVVIDLGSVREKALAQAQQAGTVSAAEGSAAQETSAPPAGTQ